MRLRSVFSKTGEARYISHLDLQRTFERAFRRAEIPVAFSQGFNPKPRFSLASALMLGANGENEVMDVHLADSIDPEEFVSRMNNVLSEGLRFHKAKMVADSGKDVQALASAARYRVRFRDLTESIIGPATDFVGARSIMVKKKTKDAIRDIDARKLVIAFRMLSDNEIEFLLDISGPTMKPTEVAAVVQKGGPEEPDEQVLDDVPALMEVTRTDILANVHDHYVPLFEL